MAKAMEMKVGNPLRKLILLKLADNANDKGECWPSYKHIADQCETSRRSVIAHIDTLVEMGLVKIRHRKAAQGNKSNLYLLDLSGGEKSALPQRDKKGGENTSPPPSEDTSPPSAIDSPASAAGSPPSETPAPSPSAAAAPRTSHSLESVMEPVMEPVIGVDGSEVDLTASEQGVDENHPALRIDTTQTANQLLAGHQPRERFTMHFDWQPSQRFSEICQVMGVNLSLFNEDQQEQTLGEFRVYWSSRDNQLNQTGWEHKLANRVKALQVTRAANDSQQTQQGKRAAVTASIMNINDQDW